MKSKRSDDRRGIVSIRLLAGIATLCLLPLLLFAAGNPAWWTTRNVIISGTGVSANDYAAVNQGQVKNITEAAVAELNKNLSQFGGAGTTLNALALKLSGTRAGSGYAGVNLGQLKTVVQPFYDRLLQLGYRLPPLTSGTYPWVGGTANDYAIANIGQVKNLFNFDVTYDSVGNGVPDWWELKYFGSGTSAWLGGSAAAPGENGLTVLQSYQHGWSPFESTVGEWRFDEGTGLIASDSSGFRNDGTLGNGVWWTPSFDGSTALQFYGQTGCVRVQDSASLALGSGPVTITAWVRLASNAPLTSGTNIYNILYKGTPTGTGVQFALEGGSAYGLVAGIFNNGNTQQLIPATDQSGLLSDGNWHQVGFVRDQSGNASLYIDGGPVGTQTGITGSITSVQMPLWIGCDGQGGGYFNGTIDHLIVNTAAQSVATIAASYNQDSDHNGLPDWWEFKYFGAIGQSGTAPAPSGNGLTIADSYGMGISPIDYYNGQAPTLAIVSGTNQIGAPGALLGSPFVVSVTNTSGQPLANAPVLFTVNQGGGGLIQTSGAGAIASGTLQVRTDTSGSAMAYYQQGNGNAVSSTIIVSAGTAVPVQFNATTSNNLVGEWKFDDGTGTTALDSSGFGNHGTLNNAATWTTSFDKSGALQFDGQSAFVQAPDSSSLALGTGPATFTAWVRLGSGSPLLSGSNVYNIVYKGTASGNVVQFALEGGTANGLITQIVNGGTTQRVVPTVDQSAILSDGNWHYVAFVRDGTGNATLYLDGSSVGVQSGMTGSMTSTQPFWIGRGETGGYFNGTIDHVIVETAAFPAASIAAAYNQDSDHNGLPDWWEFKYFGSVGQTPGASTPGGGTGTILQAYQQGTNPTTPNPGGGGRGPGTDSGHDSSGSSAPQDPALTTGPDLSSSPEDDTTCDLNWTNYGSEQSIAIQRRDDGKGSWNTIKTVDGGTSEYKDNDAGNGLVAGVSYEYRLAITYNDGSQINSESDEYQVLLFTSLSLKQAVATTNSGTDSATDISNTIGKLNYGSWIDDYYTWGYYDDKFDKNRWTFDGQYYWDYTSTSNPTVNFSNSSAYADWWVAGRDWVGSDIWIAQGQYKLKANPSVDGTKAYFYDVFIPDADDAGFLTASGSDSPAVIAAHTFTGGPAVKESQTYTVDPTQQPDQLNTNAFDANYFVVPAAQWLASGLIPDSGTGGQSSLVNNLDTTEKTSGVAILTPQTSNGAGATGTLSLQVPPVESATYDITWTASNTSDFTITDNVKKTVVGTSGYQVGYYDIVDYIKYATQGGHVCAPYKVKAPPYSFKVAANSSATVGETITITLSAKDALGNVIGTDTVVYTVSATPKNYTVPFDEASGSRYRKIGLNGRPLPDEKPHHTAESDEEKEETYIDALTLGLHHSTTDVYVPIAGSDLTITARRDTLSEGWTMRSGLRPHERYDRPFGAGWSSNLCVNEEVVTTYDAQGNGSGPTYAYITDQNGASHRFLFVSDSHAYVPMPSDSRENGDYLTSFNGSIFTDRYGTKIIFNPAIQITQTVSSDRNKSLGKEKHVHYGVSMIQDRLGNTLRYQYPPGATTLIPATITLAGHSDQTLSIRQDTNGRITDIWDPDGHLYQFVYRSMTYPDVAIHNENQEYTETVLQKVIAPDGAVTAYNYDFAMEPDQTPTDITQGESTDKYHLDVSTITDPNQSTYSFAYQFDQTRWSYNTNGDTFKQTGAPRNVVAVTMPFSAGAVGRTTFANDSKVQLQHNVTPLALTSDSQRKIRVTDATGRNTITYTFGVGANSSQVFNVGGLDPNTPAEDVPKVVFYTNMKIDYGAGLGSELFTFDPTAGLALKSVLDLSGNTTFYTYGDLYPASASQTVFPWTDPNDLMNHAGFFSKYEDPTGQTDALGHSKAFHYGAFRIMDQVLDENGHLKTYQVDALGRRMNEITYSGGSTASSVLEETDFSYDNASFPGVMTSKTVRNLGLANDRAWVTDLVTRYVPDGDGRVAQEIVDPNNLNLITQYTYDNNGNKLTSTDPLGHRSIFTYDARNRLTSVTYADGTQKIFNYDARGNKTAERNENGNYTLYAYDNLNRMVTQALDMNGNGVVDSGDLVTTFNYDAINNKTSLTDPNGNVTTYGYDGLQRLTSGTLAAAPALNDPVQQRVTNYYYDGGNSGSGAFDTAGYKPTRTVDPRGYETDFVYDALYRNTDKAIHYGGTNVGSSASAHFHTIFDNVGNPVEQDLPADQNGLVRRSSTAYDALNRPALITHEDLTTTRYDYTSTGLKWQVTDERGNATVSQYDGAGRPVCVITPPVDDGTDTHTIVSGTSRTIYDNAGNVSHTINAINHQWSYYYDARNRKTGEDQPAVTDIVSNTVSTPHLQWTYDNVGNVTVVTDARQQSTSKKYDAANRVTMVTAPLIPLWDGSSAVPITKMEYDRNGNVTKLTDPNTNATVNTYNAINKLLTTTDAENVKVTNSYDESGNELSVQDGNHQTTTFTYDGLNRNTGLTDAASKTTTFVYDALNKTSRVDGNGNVTRYAYDARNRLRQVTYADAGGNAVNNAVNSTRLYAYGDNINLTSVTELGKGGSADVAYTYDALNRVSTETSSGLTHNYSYDLVGNRVQTIYGGTTPRAIISTYDALNRLSTMVEGGRSTNYGYDLNGNIGLKQLPNGDQIKTTYDALNRATSVVGDNVSNVFLYGYTHYYDPVGNVKRIDEAYASGWAGNRTVAMDYDKISRLKTETVTSGAGTSVTSYGYDAANNRTDITKSGVKTTYTYYPNGLNQLQSDGTRTFTYDANGNRVTAVVGSGTDTYSYDDENRLVQLVKNIPGSGITTGTFAYAYDYRTRRILRDESAASGASTKLVFSGGTSVQELDNTATTPSVEYIRGSDYGGGVGGVLYTLRGGSPSYTHENRRGDVVAKTDSSGSLTYQATYEAFGTRTQEQGATLDRQKANTKEEDPTGLLDEGFRYRDLDTGSFITKDPAGFVDGPNVYTYVEQNPWTKFDPEGLDDSSSTPPPPPQKGTPPATTSQGPASPSPSAKTTQQQSQQDQKSAENTPDFSIKTFQPEYQAMLPALPVLPVSVTVPGILKLDDDGGCTMNKYGDPDYAKDGHTSAQYDGYGNIVPAPDGRTNVNANLDPYAVAPLFMQPLVKVGDNATYTNTLTGQSAALPVMEYGPNDKGYGEASIAGAEALGATVGQGLSKKTGRPIGPAVENGPVGGIPLTVTYNPGTAVKSPGDKKQWVTLQNFH